MIEPMDPPKKGKRKWLTVLAAAVVPLLDALTAADVLPRLVVAVYHGVRVAAGL